MITERIRGRWKFHCGAQFPETRPSHDEFLGTLCHGFFADERDARKPLGLVEDSPDGWSARTGGTPAAHFF